MKKRWQVVWMIHGKPQAELGTTYTKWGAKRFIERFGGEMGISVLGTALYEIHIFPIGTFPVEEVDS